MNPSLADLLSVLLYVFLGFLVLAFVIYIIATVRSDDSVLVSSVAEAGGGPMEADQYYYLPAASLVMRATAKVMVIRNQKGNALVDASLIELRFEVDTHIEPDTRELILLKYKPFAFAADEIKVTTDADGLLASISSDTEDRLSAIVAQFAAAPKDILGTEEALKARSLAPGPQATVITIVEKTCSFPIRLEELEKAEFEQSWTIQIDGPGSGSKGLVDASFQCKLGKKTDKAVLVRAGETDEKKKQFQGVLTRPLRSVTIKVHTKDKIKKTWGDKEVAVHEVRIPDVTRVIRVPVKRFAFVKNLYVPKFSSGLLIENYIRKPSQFEAFLSIPINVVKAIVSIPSELFHFKISHLRERTAWQTEQNNLAQAQVAAAKIKRGGGGGGDRGGGGDGSGGEGGGGGDGSGGEGGGGGSGTDGRSGTDGSGGEDGGQQADQGLPQLGKAPAGDKGNTLAGDKGSAAKTRSMAAARAAGVVGAAALVGAAVSFTPPTPNESAGWYDKIGKDDWPNYENTQDANCVPDCVPAAAAHLIMAWTSYTTMSGVPVIPAVQAVKGAYEALLVDDGSGGKGCRMTDFMHYWARPGLDGNKIKDFIQIPSNKSDPVKMGVQYYGGCMAGMQMPITAYKQTEWTIPDAGKDAGGNLVGDSVAGSWCGHCVAILGYDKTWLYAISCGEMVKMDYNFYETYNDESFVPLSASSWALGDKSPQGTDVAALVNNLGSLGT
jgi:hypothetical protein